MLKIKTLFILMILMSFSGCVTSSNYYVLSLAPQPTTIYANKSRSIGVKKVTVPEYLYKREIAVAKTSSQITLLSGAVWGEDLDAGLTHRLISFLQKKFQQPNVFAYPWGVDRQPSVKVNVDVTRFIAQGDKVYLDANWEVVHVNTNKRKAKLFSTTVSTSSNAASIVDAMDRAFGQLEEDVARGLKEL
ncbi:MAG: membrane integrity-associated transporter subunit PqiC [Sulfurovum sp.]|nr:PqiC family protein [Sulfurovum sp.]NNJ45421.1 membrane integrity-associated transporter subunit PqiC [Sulfurovum sp.]